MNRKIGYFWSINSDFTFGKEIRTYDMQGSLNSIHRELTKIIQKYVENIFGLQLKGNNGQYLKDYFDFIELNSKYSENNTKLTCSIENELEFVFQNVSFTYPYQKNPSLQNINLTISNKERLSIVGENGAGKTTLVKLLLRLYEPSPLWRQP